MRTAFITRTASFLPNPPVGNDDMERILGQAGGRPSRARRLVLKSNGIVSRHYAIDPETLLPTHTNAELTAQAVRSLGGEPLAAVGCLACGTSLPDQVMPNHAAMVQGELGLAAVEAVATSGVCLSGVTAMKYAWMGVVGGQFDAAVATGSDAPSVVLTGASFSAELDEHADAL